MDTLIERCAGLDVHQATVVACMVIEEPGRRAKKETHTFSTVRYGLEERRDWLLDHGVTHVAMEGTGIYWMPVYTQLEHHLDVSVVNARHVKKVPGRKTDVSDAAWLAELLRKGLLRKSFVPAPDIRADPTALPPVHRVHDALRDTRRSAPKSAIVKPNIA